MSFQLPLSTIDWYNLILAKEIDKVLRQFQFNFYERLNDISNDVKVYYLLLCSGNEEQEMSEISDMFDLSKEEAKDVNNYIDWDRASSQQRSTFRVSRHQLLQCRQNSNEPALTFLKRLRQKMKQCE